MVDNMFINIYYNCQGGEKYMVRKTFTTTIEEDLQKGFKETCVKKGEKMNDVIEAFMQGYIDGEFTLEKEVKYTLKKSK